MSGLFCCFIRLDRLSQVLSHYNRKRRKGGAAKQRDYRNHL